MSVCVCGWRKAAAAAAAAAAAIVILQRISDEGLELLYIHVRGT